jgi:hypothetical protein
MSDRLLAAAARSKELEAAASDLRCEIEQVRLARDELLRERDAKIEVRPESRVARWYIFKHKIPIWVNFGGT